MSLARTVLLPALCAVATAGLPNGAKCGLPPGSGAVGPYHIPRGFTADVVTVECDDGYKLAGDWLRRARNQRKMPGIIFLHEFGRDRHTWYPMTIMTAGRGMAVLALDLRGHGENPAAAGNAPVKAADLSASDYQAMLGDVRNAVSYLAIRNEVDGGRLAIVGSGLGANLALIAAGESWAEAVSCVVAVSPTLDDHGLAPLAAIKRIPKTKAVYLAAARDDPASLAACDAFAPVVKNLKEFFRPDTGGHGLALFGKGLFRKIPEWLHESVLKPSLEAQGPLPGPGPAPTGVPVRRRP